MKRLFALALLAIPAVAHADPLLPADACRNLSAAYTPGVDVNGKPVVPADVSAPAVAMPDKFSFDISVDAARAANLPVPPGTQALAKVGTVTVEKGALSFNGQPLDAQASAGIRSLCDDKKPETPAPEPKKDYNVVD